ncbi:MAG TPA: TIGR01777 family oxidoreductase, partial [Thermoanaerobaculia bacterium]
IGAGRWTAKRKQQLTDSRINATRALVDAIRGAPRHRRVFVSASAVGFYGPRGDEELDESASKGAGFLAGLSQRWEEEARAAEPFARTVIVRFGLVLGAGGGALQRMLLPFKLGVGGRLGSGDQWMSWVALGDLVRLVEFVLSHDETRGVYNVTAPSPVRNRDFTRSLARALRRPGLLPVPSFSLRVLFGEMADELLLTGQRVVPARAIAAGFRFEEASLDSVLTQIVRNG